MLNVTEIFTSIDGEINQWHQGVLSTFVRFSGCNLLCSYCDTSHESYSEYTIKELADRITKEGAKKVTLTGGEPLLQKDLRKIIFLLTERRYFISIETNGTIKPPIDILYLANWVMDIKLPSSGCIGSILDMDYYRSLPSNVYFKFCIQDMTDYSAAVQMAKQLEEDHLVAFSPIIKNSKEWPSFLAKKMIEDRLPYVYNLQIHKYLNVK